tara:strand:- start:272 stop:784 length:513 start_codon:yes stop_codon:yes gene_type:complete
MKSNKNIVLIGMMSSGKSTIGRILAKKLNLRFFDIDLIIENKLKTKISEIFKKKGEAFFRNLEEKTALQFIEKTQSVISLGGGGFVNEIIRKNIKKKSISIWLDWSPKTLINRIRKNKKRPIALNLNDIELKELMINRSKIYSKSKYKIECEGMTKTEIIKKIIHIYEAN